MAHYERIATAAVPAAVRAAVARLIEHDDLTGLHPTVEYWRLGMGRPSHGDLIVDAGAVLNAWTDGRTINLVTQRGRPVSDDLAATVRHELQHVAENAAGTAPDIVDPRSGIGCSHAAQRAGGGTAGAVKAGARNSAADQANIQRVHDLTHELGAVGATAKGRR